MLLTEIKKNKVCKLHEESSTMRCRIYLKYIPYINYLAIQNVVDIQQSCQISKQFIKDKSKVTFF